MTKYTPIHKTTVRALIDFREITGGNIPDVCDILLTPGVLPAASNINGLKSELRAIKKFSREFGGITFAGIDDVFCQMTPAK